MKAKHVAALLDVLLSAPRNEYLTKDDIAERLGFSKVTFNYADLEPTLSALKSAGAVYSGKFDGETIYRPSL